MSCPASGTAAAVQRPRTSGISFDLFHSGIFWNPRAAYDVKHSDSILRLSIFKPFVT